MFIKEGIQSTKDKIEAATENWTSIFIPSNFCTKQKKSVALLEDNTF
jgi:hypothetical protein